MRLLITLTIFLLSTAVAHAQWAFHEGGNGAEDYPAVWQEDRGAEYELAIACDITDYSLQIVLSTPHSTASLGGPGPVAMSLSVDGDVNMPLDARLIDDGGVAIIVAREAEDEQVGAVAIALMDGRDNLALRYFDTRLSFAMDGMEKASLDLMFSCL